jgi:hypothetical protein
MQHARRGENLKSHILSVVSQFTGVKLSLSPQRVNTDTEDVLRRIYGHNSHEVTGG